MTITDDDLESRLRRDLAELGAVPSRTARERRVPRRNRPAMTMVAALVVVLALIAASVAIARRADESATPSGPRPRVHTILEQPAGVTGSSSSIIAARQAQVCEAWRVLSTGVDCSNLQARFVWETGRTSQGYSFSAIEVVGRPDLKLAGEGTVNGAYPLFETVLLRGHRARLFGTPNVGEAGDVVTMVWNERPDLQVWIHLEADPAAKRYPTALRNQILAFARGMHPVAIDPTRTDYVLRRGTTTLEYPVPHTLRKVAWTLTWRPSGRRLCVNAEGTNKCMASVPSTTTTVRGDDVLLDSCAGEGWVGTQGLVFGLAPPGTRSVTVAFIEQNREAMFHISSQIVTLPGEPRLRAFAVAVEHPRSAEVIAQDAKGAALPRRAQDPHKLPEFARSC